MFAKTIIRSFLLLSLILIGWGGNLAAQTLTFSLGTETNIPGAVVVIPVSVTNFNSINAYQGTMVFDTSALSFQQITSPLGIPPNLLINVVGNPGQGIIPLNSATFLWTDFFGGTVSIPDGSIVMEIQFAIKANVAPGTYPVTINGSTTTLGYSDDPNGTGLLMPVINPGSVIVSPCVPTGDAGFSYPSSVCVNGTTNPIANITGDPGGTFSVDNGATINPTTGELSLASTIAGAAYSVTYDLGGVCGATSTQTIIINALDDASFTISDTICVNGIDPTPIITGLAGGTFSVDNGATIDPSTGRLTTSSLSAGTTYTITYTTSGSCPNSSSASVFVQALDDAGFTYPTTVCINGSAPMPTITGLAGGSFSVDLGASIDPASGMLDVSSLSVGSTYTISYQTAGLCPAISTQAITVQDTGDAAFSYPSSVCPAGTSPMPTITGDAGGTFSVFPAANIDLVSGVLDLSSTTIGTTYTITYALGGNCPTSSVQSITVEDTAAPMVPVLPTVSGSCSASITAPTTTDDCAGTISGTTTDPLVYNAQGTYTVTWSFDDGNGNVSMALQTVIVQDTILPVVICQDISVKLDTAGMAVITPAQLDDGSFDNCGLAGLSISQNSFTLADIGPNAITLIATDINGNVDSCIATVTIIDFQDPLAICQNITVYLDANGLVVMSPNDIDGGSSTGDGMPILTASRDSFFCADAGGDIMVTLVVTDSTGASDSCMATVTVQDTISPTVMTKDIIVNLDASGKATISASDIDDGSFDVCGIQSLSLDTDSFDCSHIGMNPVILTATDLHGNSASLSAMVTVEDNIAPDLLCKDITIQLDTLTGTAVISPTDVDSLSFDACGIQHMTISQDTFTMDDLGPNTVTLTATDVNGNSSTCTAIVTVSEMTTGLFRPLADVSLIPLELFPNPAQDLLNVRWDSRTYGELTMTIVDHLGKTVRQETLSKAASALEHRIDVQNLAKGVYLVRIQQGAEMQVGRFVRR